MKRWKKYTLIASAVALLLLLSTMLIVPWQVKKQGISWIEKETDRTLAIEKVSFNPFTLTMEIAGLNLSEQNSADPFVAFERLMISVSSRSLIDWALIFDRVELDTPRINLEQRAKQEFNFSDFTRLGDDQPAKPKPEPEKPFHFSFNNIIVNDGAIDFTDHTSTHQARHTIRQLKLQVPFVGNIPYLTDEYVEPFLSLLLNGSQIRAEGQLKPFHQSVETSLSLLLDQIDLAFYAYHFPLPLPLEVKSGQIDAAIDLAYRVSSSERPKLLLGGELALFDLELRHQDERPLFRLPLLILDIDWIEVFQQNINLLSLDIYEPELFARRDRGGQVNLQLLLPEPAVPAAQPEATEPPNPLLIKAERVSLFDGRIHLQDDYPPGGFAEEISGLSLQLDNFSTLRDEKTRVDFKLQTQRGMNLAVSGQVALQPVSADLSATLNGFLLQPHYPYLADLLTRPLEGTLNFAGRVHYDEDQNLRLQDAGLELRELLVPFDDIDRFRLKRFAVSGASFDLHEQLLSIGAISLSDGDLTATRRADGSLSPLELLRQQPDQPLEPQDQASTEPLIQQEKDQEIAAAGLTITLATFDVDKLNLQFTDASMSKRPQAKIANLALSLKDLSYPESTLSPFKLSGAIGRQGKFSFSGSVAHSPLRLKAESSIQAFPLADFNDFLPDQVTVSLKDGKVYSELGFDLQQQAEGITGTFNGRVNISDFSLRDPLTDGTMLAWESLGVAGISGALEPFALRIEEVALSKYTASILIDQEGRINLTSVTAPPPPAAETETRPAPAPPSQQDPSATAASVPPDIRIDALTLQGGTVKFSDRHLPKAFSTTMHNLGGRITGMTSNPDMQADVDLRGQLENHSPLTISGKLNPLSKDLFADLLVRFEDIDLVPMTPYAGTYLGYAIDKGKLNLDLNYHIAQRKITARNKVLIDQFTFGAAVDSDQATSLPVGLAIALLKDQRGEIHLDVPVSGDLDDPSFSIAGTIFTILKNLLIKAATSPFSLLASLLGGEEDFTGISFASGLATISTEDQQKLGKLAEMLSKRPSLTLEISAFVDSEQDPEGYRQHRLQQLLRDAKAQQLIADGSPPAALEQLEISAEEYPELLTSVYKDADFPRPRNFLGMLKTLPVPEMEKLLLTNIIVGEEELAELAKQRALQVRDALVTQAEGVKAQIFLQPPDIYRPPQEGAASRVEFAISSK